MVAEMIRENFKEVPDVRKAIWTWNFADRTTVNSDGN